MVDKAIQRKSWKKNLSMKERGLKANVCGKTIEKRGSEKKRC